MKADPAPLGKADPAPLGKADPAPLESSSWSGLAHAVLRAELERLRELEPLARAGLDPEGVHGMRVASRRARAATGVFVSILGRRRKELREDLRWMAGQLGAVRDLDVLLEHLPLEAQALRLGASRLEPILAALEAQRLTDRQAMLRALDAPRYRHLLARLEQDLESDDDRLDLNHESARAIRRAGKRLRRAERALESDDAHLEALHELRKAVKRVRYTLELLEPVIGKPAKRAAKVFQTAQTEFGMLNDAVIATTILGRLGGHGLGPRHEAALERLIGRLEKRTEALRGRCLKAWQATRWREVLRALRYDLEAR